MISERGLTILALATSIVSMLFSMIALWPQWRDRLAVIRDVVLWAALALVALGLFRLGWQRSWEQRVDVERPSADALAHPASNIGQPSTWRETGSQRWHRSHHLGD